MTGAIYCRVSTAQGDREVAGSIEQQLTACHEKAAELGIPIVEVHTEEISAYTGAKRPAFDALCASIADGRITRVVAWSTERIVRRMSDLERFSSVCEPRGVTTDTIVSGPLDMSTPTGLMVARITVAVASFEVDQLRGRVRRGLAQRSEQGLPAGGRVPFGFEPDRITHHPVEAEAIRAATKALLSGDSVSSIAKGWNAANLRTRTGLVWSPTQVRTVLQRPRNAGLVQRKGSAGSRAVWDPIISYDAWRKVCAIIADPKRRTSPGNQPRWLLSFIARCECGEFMRTWRSGYDRHGNTRVSYRCFTKNRTTAHPTVPARDTDVLLRDKIVRGYYEMGWGFPTPESTTPAPQQVDRRDELMKRREEISQMWDDELITTEEYRARLAKLDLRMEQLPEASVTPRAQEKRQSLDDLFTEWDSFTLDRKRWVVRETVDIAVHKSGPGRRVPLEDRFTFKWKFDRFAA